MNKKLVTIGFSMLVTAALALFLTGCGGGGDSKDNAAASSSAPASAASDTSGGASASGEVKAFTINAKNFEFDQKEIDVNVGDTVSITLNNTQGNHGLKISGYDQELKNGDTVTFVADKAGEFEFACSIMCGAGHADMKGKLVVS